MTEELIHEGENDYKLAPDSPAGVWIEIDNVVLWIRRGITPGTVLVEACRVNDVEYTLDTMTIQEVE